LPAPPAPRLLGVVPTLVFRLVGIIVSLFTLAACERPPARVAATPLPREVYVWQRTHHPAVASALRAHAAEFATVVVLAAEVSWGKPTPSTPARAPQITRVSLDWSALAAAPQVGLALRLNAHSGPFARDDGTTRALVALARELLAEAAAHRVRIAELHIDFDAATAKLAGYREWLLALRTAVAPVPLTFTALPTWLNSPDFPALARTANHYVLQVHSVERPSRVDTPATLCDPIAARAAIERAAIVGVPFRVALPTYGYTLAFDRVTGRFAALSAEGPAPAWRDNPAYLVRELSADPTALAALVRSLEADRPAALTGIIWYRLPVDGDRLNWSWPTLSAVAAVAAGRAPSPRLVVELHATAAGLAEISLVNRGDGDFAGPVRLAASWRDAHRLGADALGHFAITAETARSLRLTAPALRLAAGQRRPAGWLRLSMPDTTAAHVHVALEN
jgi:hypothetical protein